MRFTIALISLALGPCLEASPSVAYYHLGGKDAMFGQSESCSRWKDRERTTVQLKMGPMNDPIKLEFHTSKDPTVFKLSTNRPGLMIIQDSNGKTRMGKAERNYLKKDDLVVTGIHHDGTYPIECLESINAHAEDELEIIFSDAIDSPACATTSLMLFKVGDSLDTKAEQVLANGEPDVLGEAQRLMSGFLKDKAFGILDSFQPLLRDSEPDRIQAPDQDQGCIEQTA